MIRRIRACTHQRPKRNKAQYAISKETQYAVFKIWNKYNILEDIKRGPYSKKSPIRRDLDNSTSNVLIPLDSWTSGLLVYKLPLSGKMDDPNMTMEEYIKLEEEKARRCGRVFNWKTATYGKIRDALQCKSQVSTLVNDEIDFSISFDESDDEDYTIIYDENLFSYKMIFVNNLKTDSKNDNEKARVPSFPPPKPTTSYIDDLDFFNDFENEFPAIVYNDPQTSKSDLLTEPILSPQHIDGFNLNDETSVSEYDEEEQNILYFNDILPFNITRLDDLNSEKDNNDNDIDIIQSSEDIEPLPPRELRHPFLRYQGLEYTNEDIADFEERLERIYGQEIHRVQVVDFLGMPELMRDVLFARMRMEHRDDAGVVVFTSRAWGRLFDTRGPLVRELILEFLITLRFREVLLDFNSLGKRWSPPVLLDFLGPPPSYTLFKDPVLRICHRMMAHSIAGRSQAPEKVTVTDLFYLRGLDVRSFVARLAQHFGLPTAKILGGLTIIAPELSIIDMAEPPDAAVGAPTVVEDAPAADEGDQAIPAPVQAPQQPPPPPLAVARTRPQRMARLEEDVHEIREALTEQREVIDAMAYDFSKFSTWVVTALGRMMDRAGVTYVPYSQTHVPYQRRVRCMTDEASTSTTQHDLQQPDP
ncbi:hypothetical protein Tco_0398506 [Tanacetum coccineum]